MDRVWDRRAALRLVYSVPAWLAGNALCRSMFTGPCTGPASPRILGRGTFERGGGPLWGSRRHWFRYCCVMFVNPSAGLHTDGTDGEGIGGQAGPKTSPNVASTPTFMPLVPVPAAATAVIRRVSANSCNSMVEANDGGLQTTFWGIFRSGRIHDGLRFLHGVCNLVCLHMCIASSPRTKGVGYAEVSQTR